MLRTLAFVAARPSERLRGRIPHSVFVLLPLLFVGCAGPEVSTPDAAPEQILVAATSSDMVGVNELVSSNDRFTQDVIDAQFLHLFQEMPDFEQGPPTMAPQLAVEHTWEEVEGKPSLLIRLDPAARWSDGAPITADDVRWSWQAQTAPELAWGYKESKESIADVEVVDPNTVRFHLTHRYLAQIQDINLGVILPRHAWSGLPFAEWRQNPEWFQDNLVVSGPFQLVRWKRDVEIVLDRNPAYTGESARLDRVVFRVIPDKPSQVEGLLAGTLHFIERVPPDDAERIQASDRAELIRYWGRQYDFLCWNVENPLFADAAVRRALTLAIDRRAIVEAIWGDLARTSKSPIIASVWAHHGELEEYPYDPERAARTLEAAGWIDRDGDGVLDREGVPFEFDLLTNNDSRPRGDAAAMIQQQLKRVGIEARPRATDFLTAQDLTLAHDFDATISGWLIDTSLDVSYAFHTDWIDSGLNLGQYTNPALDRLLDEAGTQVEREAFHERLLRVQEILHEEQPYTLLWEPIKLNAVDRRVRGVRSNAQTSYFDLDQWWIAADPS